MTEEIIILEPPVPTYTVIEPPIPTYYSVEVAQQGPKGIDASFVHSQVFPSDTWTVIHGLRKWPSVTVVDSAGSWVLGEVSYIDDRTVSISFACAFSGKAFFN